MTNKEILMAFYEEVFNGHDADAARKYLREDYIQHNPGVGQGREAFIEAFRKKLNRCLTFTLTLKDHCRRRHGGGSYTCYRPSGKNESKSLSTFIDSRTDCLPSIGTV